MLIAVPRETRKGETRVAAVPETVKRFCAKGVSVRVQKGAGAGSDIPDSAFREAGATIGADYGKTVAGADVLLKILRPAAEDIAPLKRGASLFCLMAPHSDASLIEACAAAGVQAFAMELMPRISRAQSMDVLSSQANLAGYRAVIEAANAYGKAMPMMMTPAGTVAPARVFVMGVGVAGLQAIATARRLGAVVSATDVRPATEEQVASLGAEFVAVKDEEFLSAQTAGGYAKEMSSAYRARQAELVARHIARQDIVITTALIPGRPAPILVTKAMIGTMRPGAVLVDLAVAQGGNVEGARPDRVVVTKGGLAIIGADNLAGKIAGDASALFARNLFNFLSPMIADSGAFAINWEDELVKGTCLTREGAIVHPAFVQTEPEEGKEAGK